MAESLKATATKTETSSVKTAENSNSVEVTAIADTPMAQLMQLHQTYGNLAVQRWLASGALRTQPEGTPPADPRSKKAQVQSASLTENKLEESPIQKSDEEEVQAKGLEEEDSLQGQSEKEDKLQTQRTSRGIQFSLQNRTDSFVSAEVLRMIQAQRGQGEPLDSRVRFQMERSMGTDFESVRIHRDATAARLNGMLSARAFTNRDDIYFNQSQYHPESQGGKRLIAHELAHVAQQRSIPGLQSKLRDAGTRSKYEQEADAAAAKALTSKTGVAGENIAVDEKNQVTPQKQRKSGAESPATTLSTLTEPMGGKSVSAMEAGNPIAGAKETANQNLKQSPEASETGNSVADPGKTVAVSSTDPGQILEQLKQVEPTKAIETFNQAQTASATAWEKQKQTEEHSLPQIPAPTGLPAVVKLPPKRATIAPNVGVEKPAFQSVKTGKGGEYDTQVGQLPPIPPIAQDDIENIHLDTSQINTSAGERPKVDTSGEAAPSQMANFHDEAATRVGLAKNKAKQETQQDFGENNIFPVMKPETLKAEKGLSSPKNLRKQTGAPLALPSEAIGGLNQSLGPLLGKRIGEQTEKYGQEKNNFDKKRAQAKVDTDHKITALDREARTQQQAEQGKAQGAVKQLRSNWQNELDRSEQDFKQKANRATQEQQGKIAEEQRKGEEKANQHLTEAEHKAEQEKQKAHKEVNTKKESAKRESKGIWGWVKEKASAFINAFKEAVNFIYDNLRKAVKQIFEVAKALVKSLIELARKAIVSLIKALGQILKGLVNVIFAAIPEWAKQFNELIDKAVDVAVKAVEKIANFLKKAVDAVLDFLASTIDKALGLIQSIYNGILTIVGMIIRGEFAEIMKRIGYLVTAAKQAPSRFEAAAYEELLGGDLDEPLSPQELAQAGKTPPGPKGGNGTLTGEGGDVPGPPWTAANVGVDQVDHNMELAPELVTTLQIAGGGAAEFGQSNDADRTMNAIMSEATGEKDADGPVEQKNPDDGLTPRQRAEVKWTLMKQGLANWWESNKVTVIAGAIAAILGVAALIVVTGGAILGVIPPLMSVLGPIFIGMTAVTLGGYLQEYVSKAWNNQIAPAAKNLAKAMAAGAIEVISWLTFKAGGAALKGAKAAAKGGVKAAKNLAKGGIALAKKAAKFVAKGVKYVIEKGKVFFKGIAGSGIGKRVKSLGELGKRLLDKVRFKKFRITIANRRFKLEGFINPWVLLADGSIEYIEQEKLRSIEGNATARVGDRVKIGRREGVVIGSHTSPGEQLEAVSEYVRDLNNLSKAKRASKFRELKQMELEARKANISGGSPFNYDEVAGRIGTHCADAIQNRGRLATSLGSKPKVKINGMEVDQNAHHIIPVELIEDSPVLQQAIREGFDFNGKMNGKWLSRYSSQEIIDGKILSAHPSGVHASHPGYTERIRERLFELGKLGLGPGQAKEEVENLAKSIKELIEAQPKVKINDLDF